MRSNFWQNAVQHTISSSVSVLLRITLSLFSIVCCGVGIPLSLLASQGEGIWGCKVRVWRSGHWPAERACLRALGQFIQVLPANVFVLVLSPVVLCVLSFSAFEAINYQSKTHSPDLFFLTLNLHFPKGRLFFVGLFCFYERLEDEYFNWWYGTGTFMHSILNLQLFLSILLKNKF